MESILEILIYFWVSTRKWFFCKIASSGDVSGFAKTGKILSWRDPTSHLFRKTLTQAEKWRTAAKTDGINRCHRPPWCPFRLAWTQKTTRVNRKSDSRRASSWPKRTGRVVSQRMTLFQMSVFSWSFENSELPLQIPDEMPDLEINREHPEPFYTDEQLMWRGDQNYLDLSF